MRRTQLASSVILAAIASAASAMGAAGPVPDFTATHDAGGLDLAEGLALGADDAAFLAGTSHTAQDKDMVTVKVGSDGRTLWSRIADRGSDDSGADVVVTPSGDVIAAGTIVDASGTNSLLQKYSTSGEPGWATIFDKGTAETARALAADASGNLYLTGVSMGSNGGDCFLAKFAANGAEAWAKPVNLYWLDECFDVATDASGNAIVAGRLVRDGNFDVLVRKFSPAGEVLWTRTIATPAREEGRGVATAPDGSIFVSGTTTTLVEGGGSHTDMFVAKLQAETGEVAWSRSFDLGGGDDEGRGAAADSAGGVYVTGFGIVNGEKQSAIVKLSQAGVEVWRHIPGRSGVDGTGSIAVTADGGRVAIAGALQDDGADFDYLLISYAPGAPVASFLVLGATHQVNEPIVFQESLATGSNPIVTRTWDYGDGTTSADGTHTYTKPGSYVVKLTVVDAYQTTSTMTMPLLVSGSAVGAVPQPTPSPEESSRTPGFALVAAIAAIALAARLSRRG